LAAFSPTGLRDNGYRAFLEMLRHAMRHAGGVRIDHALGLGRLWVVPEGGSAKDGAYLAFPITDLLRLIALESTRARAIVLGEDLGTVPEGFQDRLAAAGTLGMRVLWFEKRHGLFLDPRAWTKPAAAMTSTHDLATVAGWWTGRDLEWRGKLGLSGGPERHDAEAAERVQDRAALWAAFEYSGAAQGPAPGIDEPATVVDTAIRHMATAACDLVILPIEDALGLVEQPNLPGTLDEHPNWRRRLDGPAANLLDDQRVAQRLQSLNKAPSTE
jgi:4-alpha-glucanotransferase